MAKLNVVNVVYNKDDSPTKIHWKFSTSLNMQLLDIFLTWLFGSTVLMLPYSYYIFKNLLEAVKLY